MPQKELPEIAEFYKKRFGYAAEQIANPPLADVKLIIVIPCFNEPDLITTLQSLTHCTPTAHPVEIIVVVNAGKQASPAIIEQNQLTKEKVASWIKVHNSQQLIFHIIDAENLPPKHAGVGLARKIGMDEALYRFASIPYNGLVVCLDADCTVAPNYLETLEKSFLSLQPNGCAIYFEHNLTEVTNPVLKEGIMYYELFLRYYIHALRYSEYPFAVHTIGSAMAVRADIYAKTGGMNRRKAGEDFYFIHKIIPQGQFRNITETTVFPSARISDRVPFGTGKAQQDWVNLPNQEKTTYNLQTFQDLKQLITHINQLYHCVEAGQYATLSRNFSDALRHFLEQENFLLKLKETRQNTNSLPSFHKRFFYWLDGFKVLKFVHFARDQYYPNLPLLQEASKLINYANASKSFTPIELLQSYRNIDKHQ